MKLTAAAVKNAKADAQTPMKLFDGGGDVFICKIQWF